MSKKRSTSKRRRTRARVLHAFTRRPTHTPYGLVLALGVPYSEISAALNDLAAAGLISNTDNEKGSWTMRSKRKMQAKAAAVGQPRDLRAEHNALVARMYGEEEAAWSAAHRPIASEPDLAQRLDLARLRGMAAPDLSGVPSFRRAAEVERLLNAFEDRTAGGPCDWCGTTLRRHGRGPHSTIGMSLRNPVQPPGFCEVGTNPPTTACGWCASVLSEEGSDGWRCLVYRAVAGVATAMDGWDLSPVVPSAIEASDWGAQPVSEGLPFAYLTQEHRANIRLDAMANVSRNSWVTTEGKADDVSIPGIASPVHTEATLPPRPPVRQAPLSRRAQRLQDEAERAFARLAKEREGRAVDEARRLAGLAATDTGADHNQATIRFNELIRSGKSHEQALAIVKREVAKAT